MKHEARKINLGSRKILLEYDSQEIVWLVSLGCSQAHSLLAIINDVQSLIKRDWVCKVEHVLREANLFVDFLAKLGVKQTEYMRY